MAKEQGVEVEGKVLESHTDNRFTVELENGHRLMCYLSGKMRKNYIRVLPDDRVRVAMSLYDMSNGRIVFRHK